LGALLDAVCAALRELPYVQLDSMPRMADFSRWVVAAEPALLIPRGRFLVAYRANREGSNVAAIEASVVGPPILRLIESTPLWQGTCEELLQELSDGQVGEKVREQKEWPKTGRGMRGALDRVAPTLRTVGILVRMPERSGNRSRDRILTLERIDRAAKPSVSPDPTSDDRARQADDLTSHDRPQKTGPGGPENPVSDDVDDSDDLPRVPGEGRLDRADPAGEADSSASFRATGGRSSESSESSEDASGGVGSAVSFGRSADDPSPDRTIDRPEPDALIEPIAPPHGRARPEQFTEDPDAWEH
jgi:hypothetical protein